MNESMGELPNNIKEKAQKAFRENFSSRTTNSLLLERLSKSKELALKHLEQLDLNPSFLQENNPELNTMRSNLNSESGIIISNHPGWADTALILSVIKRDDVKIMMNKNYFNLLPTEVADKYFFPNEKDPSKSIGIFKRIQDHIKSGGVLLIYPSGGNEDKNGTSFKDGFRVILRGLEPTQMVYCFNINNEDTKKASKGHHSRIGFASEILLPVLNYKKSKNPQTIRVDEAYTQAGDWQEASEGFSKEDINVTLTKKYENMFLQNK